MNDSALDQLEEVSDLPPRMPEGEYELLFLGYETALPFGKDHPRLFMDFKVTTLGEFFGVKLRKFYNVAKLTTKPGKNGKCKHKPRGDFMIDYCNLFSDQRISRLDRVPMERFNGVSVIGKIRNVTKNSQQRKLPEQLQYSVIEKLLRVEK